MTAIPSGIFRLSNELLRDILDHIEADPDKLVNLDRRAYLSQESFRLPELPSPDQAQDVANLRLTCRRFSELGAIHQFARVTTRFSRRGLRRLEWIAGQAHLAKHVKKFSYMVPYFYVEGKITLPCWLLREGCEREPECIKRDAAQCDMVAKCPESRHLTFLPEDAVTVSPESVYVDSR